MCVHFSYDIMTETPQIGRHLIGIVVYYNKRIYEREQARKSCELRRLPAQLQLIGER